MTMAVPAWDAMTEEQTGRWTELLDGVAGLLPSGAARVVVDGAPHAAGLARVTRPGGRLALFHPTGRAALAARHNRALDPDEPLAEARLGPLLAGAGWILDGYDDAADRFLALATRR
jgi:hypothetical protein